MTKDELEAAIRAGADLTGADLRGANLNGVNLRGANLTNALFHWTDLRGAFALGGVDLTVAIVEGGDR